MEIVQKDWRRQEVPYAIQVYITGHGWVSIRHVNAGCGLENVLEQKKQVETNFSFKGTPVNGSRIIKEFYVKQGGR